MTTPPKPVDTQPDEAAPYISPPPPKADVDQVSRDQGLITDEWAPDAAAIPPKA